MKVLVSFFVVIIYASTVIMLLLILDCRGDWWVVTGEQDPFVICDRLERAEEAETTDFCAMWEERE